MRIQKLVLTDFRNYRHLSWAPEHNVTVLNGENGSGKTNLLEAVSLLSPGRGLRGAAMNQLARFDCAHWGVAAHIETRTGYHEVGTGNDPAGSAKRVFRLDGEPVRAHSDIASLLACVWLTPQMDRLFSEAASGRRRFLDRLVVALDPNHARETAAHDRSVAQRNRLLTERPSETAWLNAVEDSIARHAVAVTASRITLIEAMNLHIDTQSDFPESTLALECAIGDALRDHSALAVEDLIRHELSAQRKDDIARGLTGWGAHRADLKISDRASGRDVTHSSSGQQKAMLIGIVLAHAAIIAAQRGEAPIMLLDEPLVHLDEKRRGSLLEALTHIEAPIFLTGTDRAAFAGLSQRAGFLHVEEGKIHPEYF
ncbi:DNA replication/repair protein RecF [Kozakia baliensis]|uniref:DNA replication/repair protein RecF n=1 Tax=Kozakia baliensis TaxID=153496 RepID=UPI00345BEA43